MNIPLMKGKRYVGILKNNTKEIIEFDCIDVYEKTYQISINGKKTNVLKEDFHNDYEFEDRGDTPTWNSGIYGI